MSTKQEFDLTGLKGSLDIDQFATRFKQCCSGHRLTVIADDPVFHPDVKTCCMKTGFELLRLDYSSEKSGAVILESNIARGETNSNAI